MKNRYLSNSRIPESSGKWQGLCLPGQDIPFTASSGALQTNRGLDNSPGSGQPGNGGRERPQPLQAEHDQRENRRGERTNQAHDLEGHAQTQGHVAIGKRQNTSAQQDRAQGQEDQRRTRVLPLAYGYVAL